jgi:DNA-binding MarR family transcriptional regulator
MTGSDANETATLPLTIETYSLRRSLGYLVTRNARAAIARAEAAFASDAEVDFPQFLALMLLREGVAKTPGDLASLVGYDSSAITRLVDRLERRGLVERVRSVRDRRSVHIHVTAQGDAASAALLPRLVDNWNALLVDFDPEEYRTLVHLLGKLLAALEGGGAPPNPGKSAPVHRLV